MKPRLVAHFELLLATIGAEPQDLGASFCAFSGSADDLNKKSTGNNAFQAPKNGTLAIQPILGQWTMATMAIVPEELFSLLNVIDLPEFFEDHREEPPIFGGSNMADFWLWVYMHMHF